MKTPTALLTAKQAIAQDSIRRIYQPMWKAYRWTADGCGDTLYATAKAALVAYKTRQLIGVVMTQKQIESEAA